MNVQCDLWFPTPVYRYEVANYQKINEALLPHIRQYQETNSGIQGSNILGYHSDSDLHFKPEFNEISQTICEAMTQVEKTEELTQSCELVNLWFNVNPPHSHNANHTHPRCDWSGVYYVQTPEKSGLLHLDDPRDRAHSTQPKRKSDREISHTLWRNVYYQPKPGMLLFFPSWLSHSVGVNLNTDLGESADRISISFNFVQKWFTN